MKNQPDDRGERMRIYLWVILSGFLMLALLPVMGQQGTPIQTAEEQPAGYYIIKLRYLTVGQITAYFKEGGPYAQFIPPGVESIAVVPSLQSLALKSANPEDVLAMTRLIMQLDRPAKSYDITCTLVITNGAGAPLLPANFATLPVEDFTNRVRHLVALQQASVITYPNLHIDLTERGDIVPQETIASYRITPGSVDILPSAYAPATPAFRISHLPPAANAPTSGRFHFAGDRAGSNQNDRTNFVIEKHEMRNTVVFSYTGLINSEKSTSRVYMIVTMYPR